MGSAKATHYNDIYGNLESRDGEHANTRHRQTKNTEKFFSITDGAAIFWQTQKGVNAVAWLLWGNSSIQFPHSVIPFVASA